MQSKEKNNLLTGGLENTQENFANFCCEVGQLLCRSLAITHEKFYKPTSGRFCACSPLGKMDEWGVVS